MKKSFCQRIAVVCILAIGVIVAPFVQEADATSYVYHKNVTIHRVVHYNGNTNHYLASVEELYATHYDDRGVHGHGYPTVTVKIEVVNCDMSPCYQCNRS